MVSIALIWFVLFVFVMLAGNILSNLLTALNPYKGGNRFDLFQFAWLGYAFIIGFNQIYSLFFPVDHYAFLSLLILAGISLGFGHQSLLNAGRRAWKDLLHHKLVYFVCLSLVILALAYCSARLTRHYDTAFYHLNAVEWANAYPAVPGIVNLHGRLAYNSSFHMFGFPTWSTSPGAVRV
jgi:hypothetical protein